MRTLCHLAPLSTHRQCSRICVLIECGCLLCVLAVSVVALVQVRLLRGFKADLSLQDASGHAAAFYCTRNPALRAELTDPVLAPLLALAAVTDADEVCVCGSGRGCHAQAAVVNTDAQHALEIGFCVPPPPSHCQLDRCCTEISRHVMSAPGCLNGAEALDVDAGDGWTPLM